MAVLLWVGAALWSVGVCALYGYRRDPATLKFILGFPDWVFWGIMAPWAACVGLCFWFAYGLMKDADLGAEADGGESDRG